MIRNPQPRRHGLVRTVFSRPGLLLFWLVFAVPAALSQTLPLINVGAGYNDDAFTAVLRSGSGGPMLDPANDQQTGQGFADFLSTNTNPGFFISHGQLANGTEVVAFRFVFSDYRSQGFNSSLRVGMDLTLNGAIDLYFGVSAAVGNQNQHGIYFQNPTGGANVSPSTTSLTNNYNQTSLTTAGGNANYNYQAVTIDGVQRGMLTFAISIESIDAALKAINPDWEFDAETIVRFIAFTATQQSANSINQDIFGTPNGSSSTVRFDAPGGGFSEYISADGSPIPEPSAYGAILVGFILGCIACRRRPRPARG